MNKFANAFKNWFTGDEYEDEMYSSVDDEFEPVERPTYQPSQPDELLMDRPHSRRNKNLRVVEHPAAQNAQVVVIEPKAFEEALQIIEHLRSKRSVILNLHLLDHAQSQRVVDFLAGATHAIDGNQQRIGDGVFIFTPNNVAISTEQNKRMEFGTEAFWQNAR
jgi:cell division inhibitor SepF